MKRVVCVPLIIFLIRKLAHPATKIVIIVRVLQIMIVLDVQLVISRVNVKTVMKAVLLISMIQAICVMIVIAHVVAAVG